ncbi:Protocadherin-1 [Fasciola gigantica]|uniref:Protocadherin-1 n=1 Tax=Fasciola gigantica TaxID=46835 RepID=A0A504YTZ6_FASGI|nr:Protocadherin-1 [Fasciola gigantica]
MPTSEQMNSVRTQTDYQPPAFTPFLLKVPAYFSLWQICQLVLTFQVLMSFTSSLAEDLHVYVTEEARHGTVVASDNALGLIQLYSGIKPPRILNQKDPGVSSFVFRQTPLPSVSENPHGSNWQLVVSGRLDRETICPNTADIGNSLELSSEYSKTDFFIDTSSENVNGLGLTHSSTRKNELSETNCVIVLRVATDQEGTQQIHPIHVHLQDINDNAPQWSQASTVIWFRDGDPAGTKHSIPLATDPDLGLNAVITYRIQGVQIPGSRLSESAYITSQARQNTIHLLVTDMFELIKESAENGLTGNRLSIRAKRDIDREANPQGWDLQIIASNSEGPLVLSNQLLVHVNITDVNDNAPQFSRMEYEPQMNNQKVGVVPENVPVGQVLVHLHADDADDGANAQIQYGFASSPMLNMIQHFFEITPAGELRVRQRLDVDHKGSNVAVARDNHNYVLPTKTISFQVLAVDGAEPAYAKTGTATVKLRVEDVDDEAPVIRVHPVHVWQANSEDSNQGRTEVEIAVTENDPAGQLVALVEVSDPDYRGSEMVRCSLVGSNANLFRLSQQDVTSNEYRLYTNSRLDREAKTKLKVNIECRDLADHVTNQLVGVNVLDVNDHAPKFAESVYRFTVLEDDGELEVSASGTPTKNDNNNNNGPGRSARNRTWLTPDGRAFVTATDRDSGTNRQIKYSLFSSTPGEEESRFSIDPDTGQLFPLGPFDREQVASHRFSVIAVDQGEPALTGSCVVQVTVADVNDNPPLVPHQVSTTGGYVFSIRENQLPGTRVGQIEAYDPDGMPASTEVLDTTNTIEGHNNTRPVDLASSNKLVFGLKNENDAHAFWIDPKSGVLITRAQLDREKQASYTFHVTVRDGALRTETSLDPSNEFNSQSVRRRPERSHLVSILVTVTVEDENDNDPVFVRPNATNHMILLDPAAIPGQSLLQLHAIDPDEGLNGHVTYAIRGGNAGNLFNVDPRTGLLYLENQIPRRTMAEATAAAAAAAASASSSSSSSGSDGFSVSHSPAAPDSAPAQPTYLLALEACDQGQPSRCTHFPNLQIQLRVPNELTVDPVTGQLLMDGTAIGIAGSLQSAGGASGRGDTYLGFGVGVGNGYGTGGSWVGGLSTAEILIISLSAFFAVLILVIVITICVLKQRSPSPSPDVRRKDLSALKRVGRAAVNNVELVDQAKSLRYGTSKVSFI